MCIRGCHLPLWASAASPAEWRLHRRSVDLKQISACIREGVTTPMGQPYAWSVTSCRSEQCPKNLHVQDINTAGLEPILRTTDHLCHVPRCSAFYEFVRVKFICALAHLRQKLLKDLRQSENSKIGFHKANQSSENSGISHSDKWKWVFFISILRLYIKNTLHSLDRR